MKDLAEGMDFRNPKQVPPVERFLRKLNALREMVSRRPSAGPPEPFVDQEDQLWAVAWPNGEVLPITVGRSRDVSMARAVPHLRQGQRAVEAFAALERDGCRLVRVKLDVVPTDPVQKIAELEKEAHRLVTEFAREIIDDIAPRPMPEPPTEGSGAMPKPVDGCWLDSKDPSKPDEGVRHNWWKSPEDRIRDEVARVRAEVQLERECASNMLMRMARDTNLRNVAEALREAADGLRSGFHRNPDCEPHPG